MTVNSVAVSVDTAHRCCYLRCLPFQGVPITSGVEIGAHICGNTQMMPMSRLAEATSIINAFTWRVRIATRAIICAVSARTPGEPSAQAHAVKRLNPY